MTAELRIWRDGAATWTLLLEDGRPVELRVECAGEGPRAGSVVKGRVDRVLPGIQAAFVDVGGARNGFLQGVDHADPGAEFLVQVEREALGDKGPRLTAAPTIAGWRLVFLTGDPRRTVSRRIRDEAERARLQPLVEALPGDGGFIARTAAAGANATTLEREADALRGEWRATLDRAARSDAPAVVHEGPDLVLRALRSADAGLDRIVVGEPAIREHVVDCLARAGRDLAARVELRPSDAGWRDEQRAIVDRAWRRKIWLRSGGYLVIEPTEALTGIDVNTGKYLGKGGAAASAAATNREAAAEVARQLRLRDIGGLVVVDFIQMERDADRREVLDILRAGLARDPNRTRVGGFSDLGLVELARTRSREAPETRMTTECPRCGGRGRVRRLGAAGPEGRVGEGE